MPDNYYVSVSGGKDSIATALHLRELGLDPHLIHADTMWESPWHAEYMEYLSSVLGPIEVVRGPGFEDLVMRKGMFPCRTRRFCTIELKIWPIQEATPEGCVTVLGIRAEESRARRKLPEWSHTETETIWRPLIHWKRSQVLDTLARHGVLLHPLYGMGFDRVGCWPCVFAGRRELRGIVQHDPSRIDHVADLEQRVQQRAWTLGHQAIPIFGTLRRPGSKRHEPVAFRELVAWALSSRGRFEHPKNTCLLEGLCG